MKGTDRYLYGGRFAYVTHQLDQDGANIALVEDVWTGIVYTGAAWHLRAKGGQFLYEDALEQVREDEGE